MHQEPSIRTAAPPRARASRRIAPTKGVLAGMKAPVLLFAVFTLALAATAALWLGTNPVRRVASTELGVQRAATADVARNVRAAVQESATDLTRSAALVNAGGATDAAGTLQALSTYRKWQGLAVLEPGNGKVVAVRGETIPLSAIAGRATDDLGPQIIRLPTGEARVVATAWLTQKGGGPDLLIVATSAPRWREFLSERVRDIVLIDRQGAVVATAGGHPEGDADPGLKKAGQRAGAGALGVSYAAERDGRRTTVVYTALRADSAHAQVPDLAVATVSRHHVDKAANSSRLFGLAAAGSLLAVLGCTLLALHRALLRPLRELRRDARRIARGELVRPVLIGGSRETARLGAALERLRVRVAANGEDPVPARQRRRPGIRAVLSFCAVLVLGWSVVVAVIGNTGGNVRVPGHVVSAQKVRTEATADTVSRVLNEGLADLVSVATLAGGSNPDDLDKVLNRLLKDHSRYRSVYVRDAGGKVTARAGDDPLAHADPPPNPAVFLGATSGRIPVVAASVPIGEGDRKATLMAEFDPFFLGSLLTREGPGRTWLVEDRLRIIAADRGFIAYDALPDAGLRKAGERAAKDGKDVGERDGDGRSQRVLSASALDRGATTGLRWVVISEVEASDLDLWPFRLGRQSLILGIIGATLAVLFLGWIHLVLVRALRELASRAEAMADGETEAVVYPRYLDEVGETARGFELIRQRLTERPRRAPAADHGPGSGPGAPGAGTPATATDTAGTDKGDGAPWDAGDGHEPGGETFAKPVDAPLAPGVPDGPYGVPAAAPWPDTGAGPWDGAGFGHDVHAAGHGLAGSAAGASAGHPGQAPFTGDVHAGDATRILPPVATGQAHPGWHGAEAHPAYPRLHQAGHLDGGAPDAYGTGPAAGYTGEHTGAATGGPSPDEAYSSSAYAGPPPSGPAHGGTAHAGYGDAGHTGGSGHTGSAYPAHTEHAWYPGSAYTGSAQAGDAGGAGQTVGPLEPVHPSAYHPGTSGDPGGVPPFGHPLQAGLDEASARSAERPDPTTTDWQGR